MPFAVVCSYGLALCAFAPLRLCVKTYERLTQRREGAKAIAQKTPRHTCHAERSEASIPASCQTLRFAQGDMTAVPLHLAVLIFRTGLNHRDLLGVQVEEVVDPLVQLNLAGDDGGGVLAVFLALDSEPLFPVVALF